MKGEKRGRGRGRLKIVVFLRGGRKRKGWTTRAVNGETGRRVAGILRKGKGYGGLKCKRLSREPWYQQRRGGGLRRW